MARVAVGLALFGIFVAVLVSALRQQADVECEVCVEYAGRSVCRTNLAADRQYAIQGATSAACAVLSSGVTAGIQCSNSPPKSLRCSD